MADEVPTSRSPQPFRLALGFVLPLLILAATWRVLAANEITPLELQVFVVDANGRPLLPFGDYGILWLLHAVGFFELERALQLGLQLGIYGFGVVLLGALSLWRTGAALAQVVPALALYSLFPWFVSVENGAIALAGLLLFPVAVLLRPFPRRPSKLSFFGAGLLAGLLLTAGGPGFAAGLALLLGSWLSRSPLRTFVLLLAGILVPYAGLLLASWLFEVAGGVWSFDPFADLRTSTAQGALWIAFAAAAVVLPGLFGVDARQREPGSLRIAALLLAVVFAIFGRSQLAELDRTYRQDRQSLLAARQGMQVGFPWIVLNLPLHLRPSLALATPAVQWPLVRLLALPDTGEQVHVPAYLPIEEWLSMLRYSRDGMRRTSWRNLLLHDAMPRAWAPEGDATFADPLTHMLGLGQLRNAARLPGIERFELAPVADDTAAGLELDIVAKLGETLRIALLFEPGAAGEAIGFDGRLRGYREERFGIERIHESDFAVDVTELTQGHAQLVGHARGYGPILELTPSEGLVRGKLRVHLH